MIFNDREMEVEVDGMIVSRKISHIEVEQVRQLGSFPLGPSKPVPILYENELLVERIGTCPIIIKTKGV